VEEAWNKLNGYGACMQMADTRIRQLIEKIEEDNESMFADAVTASKSSCR
jgi:hypothetical protein